MRKKELLQFYETYKLYIFPIAVVLSSIFLIAFIIYPQAVKLFDNRKAAEDLLNKTKFLESKVKALEGFDEKDLSGKVDYALNIFPAEKDYGNIIGLMQQISLKSGFSITAVNLGDNEGKVANSNTYSVDMQAKGAKPLLPTLLSNLENAQRLMKIDSIEVTNNQAAQTAEVSLKISVFYLPTPQNFGSEDSPLPQISQKEEELLASLAVATEAGPSSSVTADLGKANPFE